jgi:hypothetical protein
MTTSPPGLVNRRDFLLLRIARDEVAELSCERLFMRFIDAQSDGDPKRLFDVLADDLKRTRAVRLTDVGWLAREDLRALLEEVLAAFAASGGTVTRAAS